MVAFQGTYREGTTNLKQHDEHVTRDAWRMGRPEKDAARSQRARAMPLVLDGGASAALHLLFGLLCSRVEAAVTARLLARTDTEARQRRVCPLWA